MQLVVNNHPSDPEQVFEEVVTHELEACISDLWKCDTRKMNIDRVRMCQAELRKVLRTLNRELVGY